MAPTRGGVSVAATALCLALAACAARVPPVAPAGARPEVPAPPTEPAPGPALLLRGATVMTAAGPTLPRADVLVRGGRIDAVALELRAPANARIIDAAGRWITPGLIDPHSHVGVYPAPGLPSLADGNEMTGPFQPQLRAVEALWPQDPTLARALAGGVTTLHVLPGSANLVGGQGVTIQPRRALSAAALRLEGAPTTMKMACGENPRRLYGSRNQAPSTRMAEVAMLREQLQRAREYADGKREKRDFGLEALAAVLDGEILIQNHCYRADEMLLRLQLFREFDVAPRAFHHAVEAYKIAPQLAAADVAAVIWADWWGVKTELLDAVPAGAALLELAGARVALHSDDPQDLQRLNQQAAAAWTAGRRAGLEVSRDRALRWVTANPAWVLGIDDQVGTLEPGKRADLVVWSGDPFSVYSRADLVFMGGELAYDRSRPAAAPSSDFELGLEVAP